MNDAEYLRRLQSAFIGLFVLYSGLQDVYDETISRLRQEQEPESKEEQKNE